MRDSQLKGLVDTFVDTRIEVEVKDTLVSTIEGFIDCIGSTDDYEHLVLRHRYAEDIQTWIPVGEIYSFTLTPSERSERKS